MRFNINFLLAPFLKNTLLVRMILFTVMFLIKLLNVLWNNNITSCSKPHKLVTNPLESTFKIADLPEEVRLELKQIVDTLEDRTLGLDSEDLEKTNSLILTYIELGLNSLKQVDKLNLVYYNEYNKLVSFREEFKNLTTEMHKSFMSCKTSRDLLLLDEFISEASVAYEITKAMHNTQMVDELCTKHMSLGGSIISYIDNLRTQIN